MKKAELHFHFTNPALASHFGAIFKQQKAGQGYSVAGSGDSMNLDSATVALLVAFLENGGLDLVRYLVEKILAFFADHREEKFIKVSRGETTIEITTNMTSDEIRAALEVLIGVN
jgi:hypothetical protein